MTASQPARGVTHLRQMVALVRPYRGRWLLATLALIGSGALNLALPQAVRLAVDEAVRQEDRALLAQLALVCLAAFVLLAALFLARTVLMSWLGHRVVTDLRRRTFRHLLRQPPGFFEEHDSGELVSRLTADIGILHYAVSAEFSLALRSMLMVVGGLALLLWTSPSLTLVMLATVPPIAVGGVLIGRRIRDRAQRVQQRIARANARLKEAAVGIETVQGFRAEEREAARYGERVEGAFRDAVRVGVGRGTFAASVQLLGYTAVALVLWLGGQRILDDALSPGELGAFLLYALMVNASLVTLAQLWGNLQRAVGATGRIFELLDAKPAIETPPDAVPLPSPRGEVEVRGVSFAYPTRPEATVLHDLHLRLRPGETLALVGRSGSGKSTLAALLQRFHDPDRGAVTLDGHDLRHLRLDDLRRVVALVHQEPMLFSDTIGENLRYAAPEASESAVREAARRARVDAFVDELPEGWATLVGERGVRLSGGQRQRLAIARALLADPHVLILDEATSHLDATNEAHVQEALRGLMAERTTLVIAHRLSTVREADRIAVLDRGHVVEEGSHETLLARHGLYHDLVAGRAALQ